MSDRHPGGLAPRRQRHRADAELLGNLGDRRAVSVAVERDRVPFELVGIILPCNRDGSSRFPRQSCGIQRVQHTGSGPERQRGGSLAG